MPQIKVSEKALAHLSKGLYRSPASAVRELVSNAWDAGATKVEISTFAPVFNRLVITDNGAGFRRDDFMLLMNHGIGNSIKRTPGNQLPSPGHGRPTLGRLGIGLLGVAQICSRFRIQSRSVEGDVFGAELRIQDSLRKKLDANDPTVVTEIETEDGPLEEIAVGNWDFVETIDLPGPDWTGTQILVTTPLASFTESFITTLYPITAEIDEQEDEMADRVARPRYPTPEETETAMPQLDWKSCVREVATKESVMMRGDYWRFLWELSVTCPLPYFSPGAVPRNMVERDHERLSNYDFELRVDGRQLRKPVWLPKRENGYSTRPFSHDLSSELGRPLKFHGYLVVQEGAQLRPAELRGILIRIREVGVGYYDPSLLDWQTNQGPRSRWVTGEIFVETGLEDAMNVDRDSFNRYHPDFKAVQRAIHAELATLFKKTYKKIQTRSEEKREDRTEKRRDSIAAAISDATGRTVRLVDRPVVGPHILAKDVVRVRGSTVEINPSVSDALLTKKTQRELGAAVLALFDAAMATAASAERRREVFLDGLIRLLRLW